jgi:hypothetical protein
MIPSFEVPPQYFYALATSLPPDVSPAVRYRLATSADQVAILDVLHKAVEDRIIEADPVITVEMAARRLASLGSTVGVTPVCDSGVGLALTTAYTDFASPAPVPPEPAVDVEGLWGSVITTPALAEAHLELVLCAITLESDSRPLIAAVQAAGFTLDRVKNLDASPWPLPHPPTLTFADWLVVFTGNENLLPPSVGPGTLNERVGSFVRMLKAFFAVKPGTFSPGSAAPGGQPTLPRPANDLVQMFFDGYRSVGHATFEWGDGLVAADRDSVIATLTLTADAAAWLAGVADALDAIYAVTAVGGISDPLHFSFAESLWARGFVSRQGIAALTKEQFTNALIGTPAYDRAGDIWSLAGGVAASPGPVAPGPFFPINPGNLVNCDPPCELSPTGVLAYLQALLAVAADSGTIADLVADRAGPLGDLEATTANATIAIPAIDLVNESLEAIAAGGDPHGVIHNTVTADAGSHDPASWFRAVPSYSTPAVPVSAAAAYDALSTDFSAPSLPYDQRLDVNRRYLEAMGTTRFDVLRGFRRDITEFVLDRAGEPADFPRHVWRYPVRLDVALESLCISPAEYEALFSRTPTGGRLAHLYGFDRKAEEWTATAASLPEFLTRLGISYCDLVELADSGYMPFHLQNIGDRQGATVAVPDCEPCCLGDYRVVFDGDTDQWARVALFVRLWRKLGCTEPLTFAELTDICTVLKLFDAAGTLNPDFIPQLAALLMLRHNLRISDPIGDTLDLWRTSPPTLETLEQLIDAIADLAARRHHGHERGPQFRKLLISNLDRLSILGGFDPATATRTWHARPTHTLRFAEILAKIWASRFGIGELTFLFTADEHLSGDDPFPLSPAGEAQVDPLENPDDIADYALWDLRDRLLAAEPDRRTAESYTWWRIRDVLVTELGWTGSTAALTSLASHLFPGVLERSGTTVPATDRRYTVSLAGSSSAMWNTPESPFLYDDTADELSATVPFADDDVLEKLGRIRPLSGPEREAVQNLFATPSLELAQFTFFLGDLAEARERLIAEPDEEARWHWFRAQFALFHARCAVIAGHLADHVLSLDGGDKDDAPDGDPRDTSQHSAAAAMAWRLLRVLLADENSASPPPWEDDAGSRPSTTWPAPVSGGAFAAIAGLTGSGLLAEHSTVGGTVAWRELQATSALYSSTRRRSNTPVPTVLPALDASLPAAQERWAAVRNGIGIGGRGAQVLGGISPFRSRWTGALLVEADGDYTFWADDDNEDKHYDHIPGQHWQVTLQRGQKSWVVLSWNWEDEPDCFVTAGLALRRGAYDLTIELVRDAPTDDELEDARALRCGLRVDYQGPDTGGDRTVIPIQRLYVTAKDAPLDTGIGDLSDIPTELLHTQYVATLRDIRRTYQRAFKSLLIAYRFGLSAETFSDYAQSELGYLLDHGDTMAGLAFYEQGGIWNTHAVDFDPNLLPILDPYVPPVADDRATPSVQRRQAWFDVWERLFDHTDLRRLAASAPEDPSWLLYDEASSNQPDNPAQLLRHLGVDISHASLVLEYNPGFAIDTSHLMDERWPTRVWRADQIVRRIVDNFAIVDLADARPDLWAAADLLASGGNLNLVRLVRAGFVDNGAPVRFTDLRLLNDCLRVHARDALVTYLSRLDRVKLPWPGSGFAKSADDLSALLLCDVSVAVDVCRSRVDAAVQSVLSLVERARLGLEPQWRPDIAFLAAWDCRYASCEMFGTARRAELYRENVVGESARLAARHSEAYRFLEDELRRATLTEHAPGGLEYWAATDVLAHPSLTLLLARDASSLQLISPREGLGLLGTPEASGQRSWLARRVNAAVDDRTPDGGSDDDGSDDDDVDRGSDDVNHDEDASRHDPLPRTADGELPLWIEAAIRLGARFLRVPGAGVPPAALPFSAAHLAAECECGCGGAKRSLLDEYYFWLVDTEWFDEIEQVADWPGWHTAVTAAPMLEWPAEGGVHLMWSRMRGGVLQQPRRSVSFLALPIGVSANTTTLTLIGRERDSLLFSVGSGIAVTGATPPPDPGFRYDIAVDDAIIVPKITPDLAVAPTVDPDLGTMTAYPYFVYFSPGAPLFPMDPMAEAGSVACALRVRCSFESALRWYGVVIDPLVTDNRWCTPGTVVPAGSVVPALVEQPREGRGSARRPSRSESARAGRPGDEETEAARATGPRFTSTCCDATHVPDATVRRRFMTLEYLETLLDWERCAWLERTAAGQTRARLLLETAARVLGPTPVTVHGCGASARQVPARDDSRDHNEERPSRESRRSTDGVDQDEVTVATFVPCPAPLNPRLMSLYERVTSRRAVLGADSAAPDGCCYGCGFDDCGCASCGGSGLDCCCPSGPYRFSYAVSRASEFAAQAGAFSSEFEAALEKGDSEFLAATRARQEQQVLGLTRAIRQEQWRDADWQVQGARIAKQMAEAKVTYYTTLMTKGLIAGEIDYRELENGSFGAIAAASVSEAIGTVLGVIPDVWIGTLSATQLPLGTKLANVFSGISRISSQTASILSGTGGLRNTQASWDRRYTEWVYQRGLAELEAAQAERSILGAERRRAAALGELNSLQQQSENSREIATILRDKVTSHAHFLWLAKETAALYRQMFEVAECALRQAEHKFNVEVGFTHRRFVPDNAWNDLKGGLLAGQQLALAARRMEAAYTNENVREYELTKHISLRKFFGEEFLALKATGKCTVQLPEWLFDLDYPGHYLRRIKSVALSVPAIVGPYTGVHARLTLLSSTTRVEPTLLGPAHGCCTQTPDPCDCGCTDAPAETGEASACSGDCARCCDGCCAPHGSAAGYELQSCDPRSVVDFGSRQAIATSSGQNDAGLFELQFRDERYLPFEYAGAASTWLLEIPPENNDFDLDELADAVMHVNLTAREGGPDLRAAASASARQHLPDAGVRLIDVAREMPDEWARFTGERGYSRLDLTLSRDFFAHAFGKSTVDVSGIEMFLASDEARPSRHVPVEFEVADARCCEPDDEFSFQLVSGADWCGFYHGCVQVHPGPIRGSRPVRLGSFEFEEPVDCATEVYLLVRYTLGEREEWKRAGL